MKSIRKGFVSAMLLALLTVTVNAQPGQGRRLGPCGGSNQGNFRQAGIENILTDLTEDQKAALAELRTEQFKQMKDYRNQMGVISAKQKAIMSEYTIDEKAAAKLIDQKTKLMNEQMQTRVAHRAAVNQILTEEQFIKLEQAGVRRQLARKGNRNCQSGEGNFRNQPPRGNRGGYGSNFSQRRGPVQ